MNNLVNSLQNCSSNDLAVEKSYLIIETQQIVKINKNKLTFNLGDSVINKKKVVIEFDEFN